MVTEVMVSSEKPRVRSIEVDGPNPGLRDKLKLFGQFVGSWKYETQYFLPDGTTVNGGGRFTSDGF